MPNIVIQTPNVTKTFSLDAAQVTRLLDYAGDYLDPAATALEKEQFIATQFFILMRDDLKRSEQAKAAKAARDAVAQLPVTEV